MTARPHDLSARPASADAESLACERRSTLGPLSDVLRAVRLTGAYFYLVEAASRWTVATVAARSLAPRILPEAEHLIPYHILIEGSCWAQVDGLPPVAMQPGDVLMLPHGDAHVMSSDATRDPAVRPDSTSPPRFPETVSIGTGSRETRFVCGFLGCDAHPFNPLIAALPRILHMPRVGDGWLAAFPAQAVRESRAARMGRDTMLTRMAELMFIEVVREYIESLGTGQTGWLAGLRDPVVGVALARMHERPAHPWSLAALAREAAVSRSVLAERFTHVVGVPPMQYLAQWRLQMAADLLARGGDKVAAVSTRVGYESEAAFSRAFKRATGTSPAEWRKRRKAS
jgi:AraC-like DNA-binding protein